MHEDTVPPPPNPDLDFTGPQQDDYFGFQEFGEFIFPDGNTWIKYQKLNEGARAKFQKNSSRDLVLERQSGNARMKVDPGADRHALIQAACVDWNLKRGVNREPVMFSERNLKEFLELANPALVDELEKAIRKFNPWLMADLTVEEIDKEIDSLKEMREVAVKREEGERSSGDK